MVEIFMPVYWIFRRVHFSDIEFCEMSENGLNFPLDRLLNIESYMIYFRTALTFCTGVLELSAKKSVFWKSPVANRKIIFSSAALYLCLWTENMLLSSKNASAGCFIRYLMRSEAPWKSYLEIMFWVWRTFC